MEMKRKRDENSKKEMIEGKDIHWSRKWL